MKQVVFIIFCLIFLPGFSQEKSLYQFVSADELFIGGTPFAREEKQSPYDRLPAVYQDSISEIVWRWVQSSAGLSIGFITNSTSIKVRWELLNNFDMIHMAETGIKGVDLYYKSDSTWHFVAVGKPYKKANERVLISNMDTLLKEFRLYLPLYDRPEKLEIGIDTGSIILPAKPEERKKVVFYGTSIMQGGCTTRPGLAFPSIMSRKANIDAYNFGFSGNGIMQKEVIQILSEIEDVELFLFDCVPNMWIKHINSNVFQGVEIIRKEHPEVPIVFIEGSQYHHGLLDEKERNSVERKNEALANQVNRLKEAGFSDIYLIKSDGLLGDDSETTVDGIHFNDLGFMRYAENLLVELQKLGVLE